MHQVGSVSQTNLVSWQSKQLEDGGSHFAPIPFPIVKKILHNCTFTSHCTVNAVSKVFCSMTQPFLNLFKGSKGFVVGKKEWEQNRGHSIGEEPPISQRVYEYIEKLDPLATNKVCFLTLIPAPGTLDPYPVEISLKSLKNHSGISIKIQQIPFEHYYQVFVGAKVHTAGFLHQARWLLIEWNR